MEVYLNNLIAVCYDKLKNCVCYIMGCFFDKQKKEFEIELLDKKIILI